MPTNKPVACFIATGGGGIVGFCCYESTYRNFFGPMGVAESHRGRGIGKAVTLSSLQAMAQMGGSAYAIIGGVGPADSHASVAEATAIEGSSPGIQRDRVNRKGKLMLDSSSAPDTRPSDPTLLRRS